MQQSYAAKKKALNTPCDYRERAIECWNEAKEQDSNTTYTAFANLHGLDASTLRKWVASAAAADKESDEAPTPQLGFSKRQGNDIYKTRPSKYSSPLAEDWIFRQLHDGKDVSNKDILAFIELNQPELLKDSTYKIKQNICARMKKTVQKRLHGYIKIPQNTTSVMSNKAVYRTKCRCTRSKCGALCRNRRLKTECTNDTCNLESIVCSNRPIQIGASPPYVVKDIIGEKGMFACDAISKGTFIIEYIGEIISREIKLERERARRGLCCWQRFEIY